MPIKDPKKRSESRKRYRTKRGEGLLKDKRAYWRNQRLQVLTHYANGLMECKCCGEKIYEFLCLDHIYGGGTQHRKSLGTKYIFSWLIQNNYPEGYQVLCHNCNAAKAHHGTCPHEILKRQIEPAHITPEQEKEAGSTK